MHQRFSRQLKALYAWGCGVFLILFQNHPHVHITWRRFWDRIETLHIPWILNVKLSRESFVHLKWIKRTYCSQCPIKKIQPTARLPYVMNFNKSKCNHSKFHNTYKLEFVIVKSKMYGLNSVRPFYTSDLKPVSFGCTTTVCSKRSIPKFYSFYCLIFSILIMTSVDPKTTQFVLIILTAVYIIITWTG